MVIHPIDPIYDENSRILILGSFPSVRSRAEMFYYGHPRNRFWKVIAAVCGEALPETVEAKRALLLRHNIALWDVIESCEIEGSADNSIREVKPNDLRRVLDHAPIEAICVNGGTAFKFYKRLMLSKYDLPAIRLPSTSPANAAWSIERLTAEWRQILRH